MSSRQTSDTLSAELRAGPLSHSSQFVASPDEAREAFILLARQVGVETFVGQWAPSRAAFSAWVDFSVPSRGSGRILVSPDLEADLAEAGGYRATVVLADCQDPAWQAACLASVARIPFTPTEFGAILKDMPLTAGLAELFSDRPFEGFSAICTIHHMTDFVVLLDSAMKLGLDPRDVMVVDKEYPYELTGRVDSYLTTIMGVAVCRYSDLREGIQASIDHARNTGRRILVLDDGGYVLGVMAKEFPHGFQAVQGVVEQTTSGIWALKPLRQSNLVLPILFDVAESGLKETVEGHGIAEAAVHNLRELLPHHKLEGRRALVLGHGRVGSALAETLRRRRMIVAVFDRDVERLVDASEKGFQTGRSLPELLRNFRPELIMGCAGRDSMTKGDFLSIEKDCYLASLTSRDYEFNLVDLAALAESHRTLGRLGSEYRLPSGVRVVLVAGGFPINFHHAESMPNQHSDLIMAAMLVGAQTLAQRSELFESDLNLETSNTILSESGLLDRYYEIYHN